MAASLLCYSCGKKLLHHAQLSVDDVQPAPCLLLPDAVKGVDGGG